MLFTQDRDQLRRFFCEAWNRYRSNAPLQPLEQMIGEIISLHPEYHPLLENEKKALASEFHPGQEEGNPFLHLALHLVILEQLGNDQPAGICDIRNKLLARYGDPHQVEHRMMECLANMLWRAQREGSPSDQLLYLDNLKSL